jgi:hypothetical protein
MAMPSSPSAPSPHVERRIKFRVYMRSFNPTTPARSVIEAGLVFEDLHRKLYRNLAGRADLEPGSQQLLVGGIGSGKTTELLLAANWFQSQGDGLPLYIDITAETDLSGLNSGSLLASFGIHLGRRLSHNPEMAKKLMATNSKVKEYAYGKKQRIWVSHEDEDWESEEEEYDPSGYYTTLSVPGKLKPPLPALQRDIREIRNPLEELLTAAKETHKDIIVIFDGLDRLLTPEKFWEVVYQDLRLFRELGVSILATAPLSVLFGVGVHQSVSDHFDRVHHLSVLTADPKDDFLQSVLRKRGGYHLLSDVDANAICHYSGGVLRDLISLARDAAEEAYICEHDSVTSADIEKVVQQLGTAYLRGLGPDAIKTLFALEKSKSFKINQAANVELLVTRRVLEYSSTDFRVHPALFSVISKAEPERA